jgi:hypothetical protein
MIAFKWSHMGLMPLKVGYLVPKTKMDLYFNMCAAIVPRTPHILNLYIY